MLLEMSDIFGMSEILFLGVYAKISVTSDIECIKGTYSHRGTYLGVSLDLTAVGIRRHLLLVMVDLVLILIIVVMTRSQLVMAKHQLAVSDVTPPATTMKESIPQNQAASHHPH